MPMTPLRLALIGCGFIGRRHLENIAKMESLVLRATVDVHEPNAASVADEFHAAYYTTDPDRVFADPDVNAVIIATYHDSHTPLALRAAAARKHILIEKPMALTVEECRRISRAVAEAGVVCSVNFKFRFAPAVLCARQAVPNPILTVGQLAMERMPEGTWVRDPVRGGGLILATACHVLDMVYFLNRSEPVRVYAESAEGSDAVSATLRFANGAVASLAFADAGENPHSGKWLHQIFDGKRSAVLHDHFRTVRFSGVELDCFTTPNDLRADGTWGVLEDFARAIRTSQPPAITPRDGLRATLLAIRILESLETCSPREVRLDDGD